MLEKTNSETNPTFERVSRFVIICSVCRRAHSSVWQSPPKKAFTYLYTYNISDFFRVCYSEKNVLAETVNIFYIHEIGSQRP